MKIPRRVIVAGVAVVAALAAVVVGVVWWLDSTCAGAFGGRTAGTAAFPGPANTNKADVTVANLAFGGDDVLGKPRWNSSDDGDVRALGDTVLQDDDKTYGGQYVVLDPANGQPRWSRPKTDGRTTIPGAVLALDVDRDNKARVARLDADTGGLRWCQTLPYEVDHNASGSFTVAADDPTALAIVTTASKRSTLAVLDTESGKTRWKVDLSDDTKAAEAGSGLVVTMDGRADSSGNTYALNAYDVRTGARLWRRPIPLRLTGDTSGNPNLTAALWGIRGGQVVTAQTGSSNVHQTPAAVAFDRTGAEKWAKPISIGNVRDSGVLSDNVLVTAARGQRSPLVGMRISDGGTLWTGPEDISAALDDSSTHDGKVYVPGPKLYVIDLNTGQSETSPVRCDSIAIVKDTLICTHGSYYGELGGSTIAYPLRPGR